MEHVTILMATYNGEKYLCEQLDSILKQTHTNWQLVISDDGSTDVTLSILQKYQREFADKINLLPTVCRFGSAKGNFLHLMKQSPPGYAMFCDQDDIWDDDKIEKTLAALKQTETDVARDCPLLVFSDLCVVNADLQPIANSFMRFSGLNGNRTALHQLLIQNVVTGCTAMMNDRLRRLALETRDETDILMHDWWLALIASAFGKICFINTTTISYRQHGSNAVGAKNTHSIGYVIRKIFVHNNMRTALRMTAKQADLFFNTYHDRLSEQQRELVQKYAQIYTQRKLKRILFIFKHKVFKNGFMRKFAQVIWG